jgi:ribose 5-phosphate isomerase RpiB
LSSSYTSLDDVEVILSAWLNTPFAAAPRYVRRLKQLDELT